MKVSCQVISDLLPLFVEGLASPASAALIEEHLEECPDCQRLRAELETPLPASAEGAHLPLKRLRRALWRKKALAVLAAVFFTIALAAAAVGYMTAPEYLRIDEQEVVVKQLEKSLLLLRFEPAVAGYETAFRPAELGGGLVCDISAWNNPWSERFEKKLPKEQLLVSREEITAVYYSATDGSEDVLLYGRDQAPGGGVATLPRLFLAYYMQLALGVALVLALLLLLLKKKRRAKRLLSRLLMLPLAYLLSQVVLIGFQTARASAQRDFFAILLLALPLYALLLTALAWVERRKQPD